MAWRREDTAYAAAALAAAAVVVYFVIANFGLVPSPLAPGRAGAGGTIAVPNLGTASSGASSTTRPRSPVAAPPVPTQVRPPSALPLTRPAADRTPPTTRITTPSGTQLTTTKPGAVDGTAADAASGVAGVTVNFTRGSGGGTTSTPAQLRCSASHRNCTWTAKAPSVAGQYTVSATATDRAGNSSRAGTITMTIVDGGDVVTTVTDVVDGVGSLLGL